MLTGSLAKNSNSKGNKMSSGEAVGMLELAKTANSPEEVVKLYSDYFDESEKQFVKETLSEAQVFQEFKNYLNADYEKIDKINESKAKEKIERLMKSTPALARQIGELNSVPACISPNNRRLNSFYKCVADMKDEELVNIIKNLHEKFPSYPKVSEHESHERYELFCNSFGFNTDEIEKKAKAISNFIVMTLTGTLDSQFSSFVKSMMSNSK